MRAKKQILVSKEWLSAKITINPSLVIGRALLAIFNNQEPEEQAMGATTLLNNIGFTAFDAEIGTKCAKIFVETGKLPRWAIDIWCTPDRKGFPKIAKYHRQLNDIAIRNQAKAGGQQIPKNGGEKGGTWVTIPIMYHS